MKKVWLFLSAFLWCFFLGCVTRPEQQEPPSKLLHLDPIDDSIKSTLETNLELEENRDSIVLLPSVDRSGSGREDHISYDLATKNITMEILSLREEGNNYRADIKFVNETTSGITARLNLYAYDQNGRLIRTRSDNVFFRQHSVTIRQFSFNKRSQEVRWIISLTGNK